MIRMLLPLGALLLLALTVTLAQDAVEAPPRVDPLLKKSQEECERYAQLIDAYLGAKFPGPPKVRVVDSQFIADFAMETNAKQFPEGLLQAMRELSERLHQVPKGYDMEKMELELLKMGVAGLYDPDKDTFYLVKGLGTPGTPGFQTTAAHELIHAYRDVDKDYWARVLNAVEVDADWAIAVTCIVEGDATLLGLALGQASTPQQAEAAAQAVAGRAGAIADSIAMQIDAPMFSKFPRAMREMLMRRYAIGVVFAAEVFKAGGKDALEAAYLSPPRSTEQVLHPEKYVGARVDEPTVITGGNPVTALGPGWKRIMTNTMGEFDFMIHFTEVLGARRAERAAAGWDGARFHYCKKDGVPSFFGMTTTWDSDRDADEFARAWVMWAGRRDSKGQRVASWTEGNTTFLRTVEGLVAVRRDGRDVLVADGVPTTRAGAVLAALAKFERRERQANEAPPPRK